MINIGITLLVIAACFYVGILYENVKILLCGTALAILFVLSVLEVLYRLFTMECHLDIPISMTDQNQPVNIGVRINNQGAITSGKVKIRLSVHNALEAKGKKTWASVPNAYPANLRYDFPILIGEAGCQEIEMKKVRIYAFTGLVYFTKRCKEYGSVIVMPEIHSIGIRITEAVRQFMGDADVYDEYRPGHDPSELFEIRPYQEKDKLQSIHWKLSAKMDDLMVREHSFPEACAVVILLDVRKEKLKKKRAKENRSLGSFLELAASISYGLMDAECAHYIAWYSREKGEITRIRVDDEESFYLFLSIYLQDGAAAEGMDIRESYKEKYRGEYYLYDLLLNKELEIYKNGEFVNRFDEKNLADECEKLEILL